MMEMAPAGTVEVPWAPSPATSAAAARPARDAMQVASGRSLSGRLTVAATFRFSLRLYFSLSLSPLRSLGPFAFPSLAGLAQFLPSLLALAGGALVDGYKTEQAAAAKLEVDRAAC
ncbi:hypothetical protein CPLU01_11129 [Colletotrichum plurivorum]|uniref:Uncharacterized protein n=1 Tax=Colletotrichum plurivorum TaxID=2175906 RepID=A0A8H6K3Q2_9PEZI|nr:hypothetical protein CPLU01_11129 [Colletotrichum plurivorum]